jgi:hypothetical protein
MYVNHPHLKNPKHEATLWRYMDFTKFLALLETEELHLSQIARFDDPFEGHPPRMVVEIQRAMPFGLSDKEYEKLGEDINENINSFRNSRNSIAASCWHLNEVESSAMWRLYLHSSEGIAIKTTFADLIASLQKSPIKLHGALVEYVNFENFYAQHKDPLLWATYKRESFRHEQEFRILANIDPTSTGIAVQVDLSKLINSVYLAPTVPNWISKIVQKLLIRYGFVCPVIQSTLSDAPSYYYDE